MTGYTLRGRGTSAVCSLVHVLSLYGVHKLQQLGAYLRRHAGVLDVFHTLRLGSAALGAPECAGRERVSHRHVAQQHSARENNLQVGPLLAVE